MERKLLAVVGATASGKTGLAIDIASRISGRGLEAVNADSRQVYRYMDIGTAKPTADERAQLTHHLLDIVDPDEPFSLGAWLKLAIAALDAIWDNGEVPIVVGGTGQYIWSLLEGWRVPPVPPQPELRKELADKPLENLLADLRKIDPESHANIQPGNVRRVIRALEVYHATGKPFSYWRTKDPPDFEWLALGTLLPRAELHRRIDARVDAMMAAGFVAEVEGLRARGYDRDLPSMSSIGYREMSRHLDAEITMEEAVSLTKIGTHRLARHQHSWFKPSDERIRWVPDAAAAIVHTREFLDDR